jgi:preprotein translocase subunit SecG
MASNTFIFFIFFIPLSIIALLIYLSTKSSKMVKYKVKTRLGNIDKKKLFILWLKIQAFIGFCSINNKQMDWFTTILIPIVLIIFLLLSSVSNHETDMSMYNTKEYEDFLKEEEENKKVEERDRKIRKILK